MRDIGLALLSGVLLVFAFPPHAVPGLVLVAYVPLLLAVEGGGKRRAWLAGTAAGAVHAGFGYSWVLDMGREFMDLGPALAGVFLLVVALIVAQQLALVMVGLVVCRRQLGLGALFCFPVLLVTCWALYPNVFYYELAPTVVGWPPAIQGAEIFGAPGVDFVIALTNGLVFTALRPGFDRRRLVAVGIAGGILAAWCVFGVMRYRAWSDTVDDMQLRPIGVVQPHRPTLHTPSPPEARPYEFDLSVPLVQQGAELVVWPEGRTHFYAELPYVRADFHRHVDALGVPLIFNDKGPNLVDETTPGRFNGALLLKPGEGMAGAYYKRKLVPFGEYTPFVRALAGPDADPDGLFPGPGPAVWTLAGGLRVAPAICYEVMFGDVVAEGIGDDGAGKMVIGQTNDGWYGNNQQPVQHNTVIPLRAVETRVSVVHVLNNGPSVVASPAGDVIWTSPQWERGAWVVPVPWSAESGGTFFTRHPGWFRNATVVGGLFLLAAALGRAWRGRARRRPATASS